MANGKGVEVKPLLNSSVRARYVEVEAGEQHALVVGAIEGVVDREAVEGLQRSASR